MKAMSTEEFAEYWPRRWEAGLLANDAWDRIAEALAQREALLEAMKHVGHDIAMTAAEDTYCELTQATEKSVREVLARCES